MVKGALARTKRAGAKEMAEVRLPPGSRAQRWDVALSTQV